MNEYKIPKNYIIDVVCITSNSQRYIVAHKGYEYNKTYFLFQEINGNQWKNIANAQTPIELDQYIWGG